LVRAARQQQREAELLPETRLQVAPVVRSQEARPILDRGSKVDALPYRILDFQARACRPRVPPARAGTGRARERSGACIQS
jgi:hypothetical protein